MQFLNLEREALHFDKLSGHTFDRAALHFDKLSGHAFDRVAFNLQRKVLYN